MSLVPSRESGLPESVRVLHLDLLHRCEGSRLEVTSATELDRRIDDIVHADLFLRRQSAVAS
jgi:hypothetical protein